MFKVSERRIRKIRRNAPHCRLVPGGVENLSDYFAILAEALREGSSFWFRGHADHRWMLTPSALRYDAEAKRNQALALIDEFRRYVDIKLPNPPTPNEHLKWAQLAQHYGLPTRLLDWTENPAIALYFACHEDMQEDALVFMLNPLDLNRLHDKKKPRVFDAHRDSQTINKYLHLKGRFVRRGAPPIAVHPVWNSDRIAQQQGVFTIHGSHPVLESSTVPSLVGIPILCEHKSRLLVQLERIGIHEMAIFPEPEHTCRFLKKRARL